jgi:hypothetical protein
MDDAPLDPWSFYAHGVADAASYNAAYTHLITVTTCLEWGHAWNYVRPDCIARPDVAVKLRGMEVTAWSFFRAGIKPEWEDPSNHNGSTLTARASLPPEAATRVWTALVAECARGAAPAHVVGVQVARKRSKHGFSTKFDVWLSCHATPHLQAWVERVTGLRFELSKRDLHKR